MRRRAQAARALTTLALAGLLAAAALISMSEVLGAFSATNANPANNVIVADDFVAPTASRSVITKIEGGTPGFIRQGGGYRVYAEIADTGNPASGVASASSNTSALTSGATASSLSQGAFSAGGLAYNYRGPSLTANASLAEGGYSYALTAVDGAGNPRTQSGYTVTVDNTAPTAADVQTQNNGATVARAEASDTIRLTFSEPVEPGTILAGWTGSSTPVVVRIVNGVLVLGADGLQVYNAADSSQLPLGTVDLGGGGYVGGLLGGEIARFGATGTASSMALSGNAITITLGTHSGQGATTALLNGTMQWTPSTTPTDRAGNALSGGAANESGSADREF